MSDLLADKSAAVGKSLSQLEPFAHVLSHDTSATPTSEADALWKVKKQHAARVPNPLVNEQAFPTRGIRLISWKFASNNVFRFLGTTKRHHTIEWSIKRRSAPSCNPEM